MDNYIKLAIRYMKKSFSRCVFAVMQVAMLTVILYTLLNAFLISRDITIKAIRAEANYEIAFFVEDSDIANTIINMKEVKSAYIGCMYNDEGESVNDNTLFVNLKNPYKIDRFYKNVINKYGINGEINKDLASCYYQGEDGKIELGMAASIILFAIIISLFGIGMIRNSLDLFLSQFEKDFGMIRCIGGTKKQVRNIFSLICVLLEAIGILCGVVLGMPICYAFTYMVMPNPHLYALPVLFVVVAFLFDLFFLVKDMTKRVNGVSPIRAISTVRIQEKIKLKNKDNSLTEFFLGIEGKYAVNNLKKKPKRFLVNLGFFASGMAVIVMFGTVYSILKNSIEDCYERTGLYQIQLEYPNSVLDPYDSGDTELVQNMDKIKEFAKQPYVSKAKAVYECQTYAEGEIPFLGDQVYTNAYKEKVTFAAVLGYDEEDMRELSDYVMAGSLDLADNEIVVINYGNYVVEDETLLGIHNEEIQFYDIDVGDTVKLADYQKGKRFVNEEIYSTDISDRNGLSLENIFERNSSYKVYTVKAIVRENTASRNNSDPITFVLPLESYLKYTGQSRESISGYKFKIDEKKFYSATADELDKVEGLLIDNSSSFISYKFYGAMKIKKTMKLVVGVVVFVFLLLLANYTNNVSANINARRKEFAQLRVIGMSKKRLIYTVALEGIITVALASIIGVIIGISVSKRIYELFYMLISGFSYTVPFGVILLGLLFSAIVIILISAVTINGMKISMADDLREDGY